MLNLEQVLLRFSLFTGLDEGGCLPWRSCCESAALEILRRLKSDVDPGQQMERLCQAAAACAYADYLVLESAAGGQLRVGNISVSRETARQDALELKEHFLGGIADLLTLPVAALVSVEEPR